MPYYYVNKHAQANGDHEVHKEDCKYMPDPANRQYLGNFSNCYQAVVEAKRYYSRADGCYYCCKECHTS